MACCNPSDRVLRCLHPAPHNNAARTFCCASLGVLGESNGKLGNFMGNGNVMGFMEIYGDLVGLNRNLLGFHGHLLGT